MNNCHDCKKEIIVENEEIKNGKLLLYKEEEEEYKVFKCNECYEKDPTLRNYKKTEVYSRVVGYIRPVQQWNKGKQEEYEERKVFNIKE